MPSDQRHFKQRKNLTKFRGKKKTTDNKADILKSDRMLNKQIIDIKHCNTTSKLDTLSTIGAELTGIISFSLS